MGLEGFVSCNCYHDGLATPFPVPEQEEHFKRNSSGYWSLDLPYEGNEDLHEQVYQWRHAACQHPDMLFADEGVANWLGYRTFIQALEGIDPKKFPILVKQLPTTNTGSLSPELAQGALKELEFFNRDVGYGMNTFLIDSVTNEILADYIYSNNSAFAFASVVTAIQSGIDPGGFFISQTKGGSLIPGQRNLFRANRFEQYIELKDEQERGIVVVYSDLDSNASFVSQDALLPRLKHNARGELIIHHPRLMHVESRRLREERFYYITLPLERLLKASIETGNPIIWC